MVEANTILQCSYLPSIGNMIPKYLENQVMLKFFLIEILPRIEKIYYTWNKLLKQKEKLKIMKHFHWWDCGETDSLIHCWWKCKLAQPYGGEFSDIYRTAYVFISWFICLTYRRYVSNNMKIWTSFFMPQCLTLQNIGSNLNA